MVTSFLMHGHNMAASAPTTTSKFFLWEYRGNMEGKEVSSLLKNVSQKPCSPTSYVSWPELGYVTIPMCKTCWEIEILSGSFAALNKTGVDWVRKKGVMDIEQVTSSLCYGSQIILPILLGFVKIKWDDTCKALSSVPRHIDQVYPREGNHPYRQ